MKIIGLITGRAERDRIRAKYFAVVLAVLAGFVFSLLKISVASSDKPIPAYIGNELSLAEILKQGYQALEAWNVSEALDVAESVKMFETRDKASSDAANLFHAKLQFTLGNYSESLKSLNALSTEKQQTDRMLFFRERVEILEKVSRDFVERESEHFVIRVKKGKDEILIGPSLDVLERSYASLVKDLKIVPSRKVLVEIYPTFEIFSASTGLSEKDVETSGTIAVCKYNRLMLTTPRVTLKGYTYKDTLCHELVHYLIYLKCGYNCPIWLHEGIAKFEEGAWRGAPKGEMTPSSEALLASALKEDRLISFERMHPSFAKLDSPYEGKLAFAEVSTAVGYIVDRGGYDLLLKLVDEMSKEKDFNKAFKNALGEPYDKFQKKWIEYLKARQLKEIEGYDLIGLKVRKGGSRADDGDPDQDEDDKIVRKGKQPRGAGKYVRIGDLLRSRGMVRAAAVEYRKALQDRPNSVRLLNKLSRSLTKSGNPQEAVNHLDRAKTMYPEYVTTYVNLGEAYFAMKDLERAAKAFEDSLDINPFNPFVLKRLSGIYAEMENEAAVNSIQRDLEILNRN